MCDCFSIWRNFRFMQGPQRMPLVHQKSLPSVAVANKRCSLQDNLGIDQTHLVTEETYRSIKALIEADIASQAAATQMYGPAHNYPPVVTPQQSMGSLPSAGSHSSVSSYGSNISQPQQFVPMPQQRYSQRHLYDWKTMIWVDDNFVPIAWYLHTTECTCFFQRWLSDSNQTALPNASTDGAHWWGGQNLPRNWCQPDSATTSPNVW